MAEVASRGGKRREVDPVSNAPASGSTALASLPKPARQEGLVVAVAHGFFEVVSGDSILLCTLRGRLRKPRMPQPRKQAGSSAGSIVAGEDVPLRIAPGDRVSVTPLGTGQGIIEDVLPRRSLLSRARSQAGGEHVMLANLDQAVLVFAVRDPVPHFGMLDRYLALCEHAGVEATVCLNKVDLGVPSDVDNEARLYQELGYRTIYTSATTREGIVALREQLTGRTSLLTGPSGVGKSSLMNICMPDANQRTGNISDATGKGRHTTTGVRLLPLEEGGWLADSAGIRELALWNVPAEALPRTFVELRPAAGECLYENCDHSEGEGGCALREALESGAISPNRFASFLRLLAEARETETHRW